MRVLFIGGTGLISSACSTATLEAGHELWLLNRGRSRLTTPVPTEHVIVADASDEQQVLAGTAGLAFDVVVQWVAFHPRQIELDLRLFGDVGQYIFISSASVFEKPPRSWMISESTTRANPFWQYSRDKIACEDVLVAAHAATGFPATIVRPSLTYGPSQIPVVVGSWDRPFTIIDRMRRGRPIIVPGDGTSIWTITHNSDFAKGLIGLFGHDGAIGEDVNITSQESLTWNQIYDLVGSAAGVSPSILHVPSAAIVAEHPDEEGNVWGDKAYSTVFDLTKLRRLVPEYAATTRFEDGIAESVAWFDADPARQSIDEGANARWDRLAAIYDEALRRARR